MIVDPDLREATRKVSDGVDQERAKYAAKRELAAKLERGRKPRPEDSALAQERRTQRDRKFEIDAAARVAADQRARNPKRPQGQSRRAKRRAAFEARGRRVDERMRAHLLKYKALLVGLGQSDADPVPVPPHVHRAGQAVLSDPTGRAARVLLASCPPAVARRIRNAALSPQPYAPERERHDRTLFVPEPGKQLYGRRALWEAPGKRRWHHEAAIRTVALGIMLYRLRTPTHDRRGFRAVVHGIPREMLCKLARDPRTGAVPCLQTLFDHRDGVPGNILALYQAGLFYKNQPPGSKVAPCDKGPSGHAFNVYWLYPWRTGPEAQPDPALAEYEAPASLLAELGLAEASDRAP